MLTDLQKDIALALKNRKDKYDNDSNEGVAILLIIYDIADIFDKNKHNQIFDRKEFMKCSGELEVAIKFFEEIE